jgi:hypothetical protein
MAENLTLHCATGKKVCPESGHTDRIPDNHCMHVLHENNDLQAGTEIAQQIESGEEIF